jgi:hypothetical protein
VFPGASKAQRTVFSVHNHRELWAVALALAHSFLQMWPVYESGLELPRHPLAPLVEAPVEPSAPGRPDEDVTGGQAGGQEAETIVQVTDESCLVCGKVTDELGNEILLCDGGGCTGAYHMLCLSR